MASANGRHGRLAASARAVYVALPLPHAVKLRLKDSVYGRWGSLFAESPRYRAWLETRDARRSGAVVGGWDDTPALGGGGAPATAPAGAAHHDRVLPEADGVWEWADYEPLRNRIAAALAERARTAPRLPRTLIDTSAERPADAARRIDLPEPGDEPDVSVIVPVYGQLRFTVECLLSIAAAGRGERSFEVIVADDASRDDTAEVLGRVANVRLVSQPRNVGFVRNCNAAAATARGRLLVLLNNDTQVAPGWLDTLAAVLEDADDIGAVGPRIVYPDGTLQDAGTRIRRIGAVEMIGLNGSPEDRRWGYQRDVDYVSGACLMIRASTWRDLGGFDEALAPAYCEDLDLGQRLRDAGLRSVYVPSAEVVHHLSVTSNETSTEFKLAAITRNMQLLAERHQEKWDTLDDVRVIAFYLPQFHPFEQNDAWWGRGFTEWRNVARARPNFVGHYQPRLPADLGFYDLRMSEAMDEQWRLASRYGIDGFCYYYYWFAGERLLDRPIERLRDPNVAAHPFCLCWANENWTRRWDGQDDEILMAQRHTPEDDVAVMRDLATYIANPAYIRVRGRPLILVYRVDLFPDFAATAERWRNAARNLGIGEIHLAMVESFRFAGAPVHPQTYGCDASVEFPAHFIPDTRPASGAIINRAFAGEVADYRDAALRTATRRHPGWPVYRGALPGWDNTARRQDKPFVLEHATPGAFQAWLEHAIAETKRDLQGDERLIFVNAWNEWAEGAYLEPDQRFGHTFLEAVRNARDADRLRPEQAFG